MIGGTSAIPASVETTLQSLGYNTARIAGSDRYETAVAVANALGSPSTVFLATGVNFPDALSAGPAAAHVSGVVLLTGGSSMPSVTRSYLNAHVGSVYAVGGPGGHSGRRRDSDRRHRPQCDRRGSSLHVLPDATDTRRRERGNVRRRHVGRRLSCSRWRPNAPCFTNVIANLDKQLPECRSIDAGRQHRLRRQRRDLHHRANDDRPSARVLIRLVAFLRQ